MFKFSILKRFPYRDKAQKYTQRAEKREMKRQLKLLFKYIKESDEKDVRATLNEMTVKYLRDRGYTVKEVTGVIANRYDVTW